MNYTASYNRGNLQVVHPQLDQNINDQRVGRKRFESHKNEESSGLSYGYGLNYAQKKPASQDLDQSYSQYKPKADYTPDSFRNPIKKPGDYQEAMYKEQNANYPPAQKYQESRSPYEGVYKEQSTNYSPIQKQPEPKHPYEAYPQYKDEYTENYYEPPVAENPDLAEEPPIPEEPKQEYYDEIEKLKEELKRKEEELAMYTQSLNKTPTKIDAQDPIYSRINKAMYDKQRVVEQRKANSSTLDYQINEKYQMKIISQQEREKEQAVRLEMLRKLKEDEALEKIDKIKRAKEYREQLEIQNLVKDNLKNQERIFYKNDLPKPFEVPPPAQQYEPVSRSNNSMNRLGYSPGGTKFTKKTPKTICYNPITGVLKDTSQYVYGSFPSQNVKDPSITYLKNQSNIPELAAHPAFQQVKYTKNNPKVVPSFPITGNGQLQDVKEEDPELPKEREQRMAEYGQLMMQNRNLSYN